MRIKNKIILILADTLFRIQEVKDSRIQVKGIVKELSMKFKVFLIAITCVLLMVTVSRAEPSSAPQLPTAFLPITTFNFPEVVEGTEIVHDFIILNKGAGPLNIQKVQTS
jgi:hypothetical protein